MVDQGISACRSKIYFTINTVPVNDNIHDTMINWAVKYFWQRPLSAEKFDCLDLFLFVCLLVPHFCVLHRFHANINDTRKQNRQVSDWKTIKINGPGPYEVTKIDVQSIMWYISRMMRSTVRKKDKHTKLNSTKKKNSVQDFVTHSDRVRL